MSSDAGSVHPNRPEQTDAERVESDRAHSIVQIVLRGGLAVAVTLLVTGLAIRLASGHVDAPAVRAGQAFSFGADPGLGLTTLGILALAVTPALRVVALVAIWWREKDRRFVAVALAVIAALAVATLIK